MFETVANIERVEYINDHYQHIDLAFDEGFPQLKPGQSLLVQEAGSYVRKQWWPVNLRKRLLVVERPIDESYQPGETVSVLGPIGSPFKFRRTLRNALLIAFDTPPTPLLMTLPWLVANKVSVTLALCGKNAIDYSVKHLPAEIEIIHGGDDFNWANQVMNFGWADQILVTVRQDDELTRLHTVFTRIYERRHEIPKNFLFGVMQPTLACGSGACMACMMRTETGMSLICVDGPAYDLTLVKFS
jgi:NAD(P)H-flavin reductase